MQGRDWYHLKLGSNGLSSDAMGLNETLLFVNLDDASSDEDRPDLLKRHGKVCCTASCFHLMIKFRFLNLLAITMWLYNFIYHIYFFKLVLGIFSRIRWAGCIIP
jgi:hypothetical protein